jgi:HEAT repeat protein
MPARAFAGRRLHGRFLVLALAICLMPASLRAQVPGDTAPGSLGRLRDRYRTPQQNQKLDEALRKFRSDDPEKRLEAIKDLGEVTDKKAVEYLVAAANDPDMRIRIKAIDVLGRVRSPDAIPLLVQQLFMRDTDLGTKQRILACLGKIGDASATAPIVDFLARAGDPATRGNAIFALGDIGDQKALPPLEAIAGGDDPVLRGLAQEAVRKIRDRPAPAVVPPALAIDRRGPTGSPAGPPITQ